MTTATPALPPAATRPRLNLAILGLIPFLTFALLFIGLPSLRMFTGSFTTVEGLPTLANVIEAAQSELIIEAYLNSIRLSAVTSIGGGLVGFFIASAVAYGHIPSAVRRAIMTFAGLAANFGGVPLAFSIIAVIGRTGFLTSLLKNTIGFDLYGTGFTLYSFLGLVVAYLYFQVPLVVVILVPVLESMRNEWREAAANLGANRLQYWTKVALPILAPTLLGTLILLFGNAFGAYATAQALTGGQLNLITIQIGSQLRGDVLGNPGLGYAMVLGMVAIMAVSIGAYSALQRRSEQWLR
jgi:putative spermidine/putrescine transport system permease protein